MGNGERTHATSLPLRDVRSTRPLRSPFLPFDLAGHEAIAYFVKAAHPPRAPAIPMTLQMKRRQTWAVTPHS